MSDEENMEDPPAEEEPEPEPEEPEEPPHEEPPEVEEPPADEEPPPPPKPRPAASPAPGGDDAHTHHVNMPQPPPGAPCLVPHFSAGKESKLPKDKLIISEGILPLQNGTNKYASQKGMTGFGVPRDVVDKIKSPNLKELEGEFLARTKEVIPSQMGSNKYASQKGQSSFGAVRDVNYHVKFLTTEEPVPEEKARMSDGIIPLQSGTNKLASQQGMTACGAFRLVFDRRNCVEQVPDSQGFIHLQMGTNRFETQAGMTGMGMPRLNITKYKDEARGEIPHDETTLPKQNIGSSEGAHNGACQAGMSAFGAFRIQSNPMAPNQARLSQGFIPYQMGINWGDSQAGKTGFGMPRQVHTDQVDENVAREPLPPELANDPNLPGWSAGYRFGASQKGMTSIGMPRDVKGNFLRRLW